MGVLVPTSCRYQQEYYGVISVSALGNQYYVNRYM